MPDRFPTDLLALLRQAPEIRIETVSDAEVVHSTIIWVVVDDRGRTLIRSYRGPSARWYREALARSSVTLQLGSRRIPATAQVATDEDRIEAASRGFLDKYAGDSATAAMVADAVLSTTLELIPR
jgi:hypothetical protein